MLIFTHFTKYSLCYVTEHLLSHGKVRVSIGSVDFEEMQDEKFLNFDFHFVLSSLKKWILSVGKSKRNIAYQPRLPHVIEAHCD